LNAPAQHRTGWTRRAVVAAGLAAACTPASDLTEGETGRIVRVGDGDLLRLDSGLEVRLSEIEAPGLGRRAAPHGNASRTLLGAAALGRVARLYYGGLSRDRYDRAIAHVIVEDPAAGPVWLNGLMVRSGGAWVRSWPDNARRVRPLYALESEARAAGRGVWAIDGYRVRSPAELHEVSGFAIVEGMAADAKLEGPPEARAVGEALSLSGLAALGEAPPSLHVRTGVRVRLRGRPDRDGGARIPLTHWGQVETLA
jgi:micrococcal nuclease